MAESHKQRLAYIDWMRGLACVLMFQTHCYDSWLGGAARDTKFIQLSQLGGTLPAPLFLFLAGISFALVTDRLRQKNLSSNEIAKTTIARGAEIFGLGLLFRVQEFILGQPWSPWTDLLRVDVLNIIGLSMMLHGRGLPPHTHARHQHDARGRYVRSNRNGHATSSGPPPARAGSRGISSPISTASTPSTSRSRGFSRSFLGRHFRSPVSPSDS